MTTFNGRLYMNSLQTAFSRGRRRCVLPPTIPMFQSFSIVMEWVEHSEIATCGADDGFATARPIPAIGVS
jgi:hypothetical protein